MDHNARIQRLHQEKAELQQRLDEFEAEANRAVGKMEEERERLKAELESKESEIARQAQIIEDSGPMEIAVSPFQDPAGTIFDDRVLMWVVRHSKAGNNF